MYREIQRWSKKGFFLFRKYEYQLLIPPYLLLPKTLNVLRSSLCVHAHPVWILMWQCTGKCDTGSGRSALESSQRKYFQPEKEVPGSWMGALLLHAHAWPCSESLTLMSKFSSHPVLTSYLIISQGDPWDNAFLGSFQAQAVHWKQKSTYPTWHIQHIQHGSV